MTPTLARKERYARWAYISIRPFRQFDMELYPWTCGVPKDPSTLAKGPYRLVGNKLVVNVEEGDLRPKGEWSIELRPDGNLALQVVPDEGLEPVKVVFARNERRLFDWIGFL